MSIDYSQLPLAKPEPRKRMKARRTREERAVVQDVRPVVVGRDGYCRLYVFDTGWRRELWVMFGPCSGCSEWSHYNETHRRSKTMGMDPEERHDRRHSIMLCGYHSQEYDQNRMRIQELTERGCDGRLRFERDGQVWEEPEA